MWILHKATQVIKFPFQNDNSKEYQLTKSRWNMYFWCMCMCVCVFALKNLTFSFALTICAFLFLLLFWFYFQCSIFQFVVFLWNYVRLRKNHQSVSSLFRTRMKSSQNRNLCKNKNWRKIQIEVWEPFFDGCLQKKKKQIQLLPFSGTVPNRNNTQENEEWDWEREKKMKLKHRMKEIIE